MGSHTLVCHEVVLTKATSVHSGWCSSGSCLFLVGQGRRQSKRDIEARATTCGDALGGSSLSPWCQDTCSLICAHWCGNICVLKSRAGERESLLATTADANLDHRSFTVRYIQSLKQMWLKFRSVLHMSPELVWNLCLSCILYRDSSFYRCLLSAAAALTLGTE